MIDTSVLISFCKSVPARLFSVGIVYTSGYFSVNPLWLLIVWCLVTYKDVKREELRFHQEAAKARAMRSDQSLVVSNVHPTPSWVTFTDSEQCEWVNTIIRHLWPSIGPLVKTELKNIQPLINQVLSNYKSNPNFMFKQISIGSISPRVGSIRVNDIDNFKRGIVDVSLSFAGDAEFQFSVMVFGFGCKDIVFKGDLRVVVTAPETASHLPAFEIFLLETPDLNYKLEGIIKVADLPGIKDIVNKTVKDVIESQLVLPNKIMIKYSEKVDEDELKFPNPCGFLTINVIEAKDLSGKDPFRYSSKSLPSPSVTVTFDGKSYTSPVVKNSRDPVWNFQVEFIVECLMQEVEISLKEEVTNELNQFSEAAAQFDDFGAQEMTTLPGTTQIIDLGSLMLNADALAAKETFNAWIPLNDVVMGIVHLDVNYQRLELNPKLSASGSPAVLELFLEKAENLAKTSDNIVAEVSVEGSSKTTRPVSSKDPVFRQEFAFVVKNPNTDKLKIKLTKEKGGDALGNAEIDVKQILDAANMELLHEKTKIVGANENSRLSISMRLRAMSS